MGLRRCPTRYVFVPDFTSKPASTTLGTLSIFHEPDMPRENTDSATPR